MMAKEESKRAAVVRTGAEREKRDLFAESDEDVGRVKETLLPPPNHSFTGGIGTRNENSVLFRVDQLSPGSIPPPQTTRMTGSPVNLSAVSTPPTPRASGASDDEGVIDLKQLSSAPAALRPVGLPVAPLFSEPPGVSYEVDDDGAPSASKKKKFSKLTLIGGAAAAAVFLLVAGFGVKTMFKGEEPVKHDAPVVAAPPPPAATPVPAKTADPPPAASTSSSSSDDSKDAPKGKKGKKGKGKKSGGGGGTGTSAGTGAGASKPAPPVKAADPCGCHGDFNCILACTAKGGK